MSALIFIGTEKELQGSHITVPKLSPTNAAYRFCSVAVITPDSERVFRQIQNEFSGNPGSNPGKTSIPFFCFWEPVRVSTLCPFAHFLVESELLFPPRFLSFEFTTL